MGSTFANLFGADYETSEGFGPLFDMINPDARALVYLRPQRQFESGLAYDFPENSDLVVEKYSSLSGINYINRLYMQSQTLLQATTNILTEEFLHSFQDDLEFGTNAKAKYSGSKHSSISAGISAGFGGFGIGVNGTWTIGDPENRSLNDYRDYNGDGYPDQIHLNALQLTAPTGGYEFGPGDQALVHTINKKVANYKVDNAGVSASGNFSYNNTAATDQGNNHAGVTRKSFNEQKGKGSGGISGNIGSNESKTTGVWLDINGDGLPDYLDGNNLQLQNGGVLGLQAYNGFNFAQTGIGNEKAWNTGGGLGTSINNGSIELGASVGQSKSDNEFALIDINGDGLPDAVVRDNEQIKVYYNMGTRFSPTPQTLDFSLKEYNNTQELSANAGGTIGFPIPLIFITIKLPIDNVNGSGTSAVTQNEKMIVDFDGDGYPDFVEKLGNNHVRVRYSNAGDANLLLSVKNPLGGSFEIGYRTELPTYDNPHARRVMDKLTIKDGYTPEPLSVNINGQNVLVHENPDDADGADVFVKYFDYHHGKYDRRQREFYGFGTVRSIDADTKYAHKRLPRGEEVYRQHITQYHNHSYYLQNMPKAEWIVEGDVTVLADGSVQVPGGKLMSHSEMQYELRLPDFDNATDHIIPIKMQAAAQPLDYDTGGTEGRGSAFVLLKRRDNYLYNLQNTQPLHSYVLYAHDSLGRTISFENHATGSTYRTEIAYYGAGEAGMAQLAENYNIRSIPKSIEVYALQNDSNGTLLRKREITDFTPKGEIAAIAVHLGEDALGVDQGTAVTEITYNPHGLPAKITYPANYNQERLQVSYSYDGNVHSYVTRVESAVRLGNVQLPYMNYTTETTYNYKHGTPLRVTDVGGNATDYGYDSMGRVLHVQSPKEYGTAENTIDFVYAPLYSLIGNTGCMVDKKEFVPLALTRHLDVSNPGNKIETITFVDGWGQVVQVKKDIELHDKSSGTEHMSVSGWTSKDPYGRVLRNHHPGYEKKDCGMNLVVNTSVTDYYNEVLSYDIADRALAVKDAAGVESTQSYSIEGEQMRHTAIVPQQSGVNLETRSYSNVAGQTVRQEQVGDNEVIARHFAYDAIGQLRTVTDDAGNETHSQYDLAGRRTKREQVDTGTTLTHYDATGNIKSIQTAELLAQNKQITYLYQYNRPQEVVYPDLGMGAPNPNNVWYDYDESGPQAGRLVAVKDGTGYQKFMYDNMGNVTNIKRYVATPNPNQADAWFEFGFGYDSWGRLQEMTYPDGEKVKYTYGYGGMLRSMGSEMGEYVEYIGYDEWEQKVYQKLGNGTEQHYVYAPELRRLSQLSAYDSDGNTLFDNAYAFDLVGNVTGIANAGLSNPVNGLGGSYSHEYNYDRYNRLSYAKGGWNGSAQGAQFGDMTAEYETEMSYDTTHRITQKVQHHNRNGLAVAENSYKNNYHYNNTGQYHTLNKIVDGNIEQHFDYDANGNMLIHTAPELSRKMFWSEDNRLRTHMDGNTRRMAHYIYDHSGERVMKATGGIEAVYQNGELVNSTAWVAYYDVYANGFVQQTAKEQVMHYYNGAERVASRVKRDGLLLGGIELALAESMDVGVGADLEAGVMSSAEIDELADGQVDLLWADLQAAMEELAAMNFLGAESMLWLEEEAALDAEEEQEAADMQDVGIAGIRLPKYQSLYFYHPDHLGTATYLTDHKGYAYQFFLNLPFGESMAEQRMGSYENQYKFTGQEFDPETGFYYYGARYYHPGISVFLAFDPAFETTWDAFGYVYNNPVRYVDPSGMFAVESNGNCPECLNNGEPIQLNDVVVMGTTRKTYESDRVQYAYDVSYNKSFSYLSTLVNDEFTLGSARRWADYYGQTSAYYEQLEITDGKRRRAEILNSPQGKFLNEDFPMFLVDVVTSPFGGGTMAVKSTVFILRGGKWIKVMQKTSGWVKKSVFNSLDPAIKKKVSAAIEKGIVSPTDSQGIIKLTSSEAKSTGYMYKIKILGKGGDIRIYGNPDQNGHIIFDKIIRH